MYISKSLYSCIQMMKPSFIFLNDDVSNSNNHIFNKASTCGVKKPKTERVYFFFYNFMQQNGTKITWQIFVSMNSY